MIFLCIAALSSCTSGFDDYKCSGAASGNDQGKVFIIGSGLIAKNVFKDVIAISGLRNRGYSVFITSEMERNATHIKDFLTILKQNKVLANHILTISDSARISKSQVIELTHANTIFIAFSSRDYHEAFLKDSALVRAIHDAHDAGATILAIGAGADLTGEITVISTQDSLSDECLTIPGLGFAAGMLVDKTGFFENQKTCVKQFVNDRRMDCAGIGEKSMLKICNRHLVVIKPEDMISIEQGQVFTSEQLKKGHLITSN